MASVDLLAAEGDDPNFVALAGAFISHYADLYAHEAVKVIHIDNWFGERWLGFAGKYKGVAGMRNGSLHLRLPAPPFRPSRVLSCYDFTRSADGLFTRTVGDFGRLHAEKNGGNVWHIFRRGLYCWYSGSTRANTTGSLMIYDVTRAAEGRVGYDAWYVGFDKRRGWQFTKSCNVSPQECLKIMTTFHDQAAA